MTTAIPLTQGKVALIDDADLPLIAGYKWHALKLKQKFYAVSTIKAADGKPGTLPMHRLLLNAPPGRLVDHKDGDSLNNRRLNIRLCTVPQNNVNRRPQGKTSRYKGVRRTPKGNWQAAIGSGPGRSYLGTYTEESEAARAYDQAARDAYGEFAYLNFR